MGRASVPPEVVHACREVATLLADGRHEQLVAGARASRMSVEDLRAELAEYGRTVVRPPDTADLRLDAVAISVAATPSWYVPIPLWTREEGRSDLTLEVTIALDGDACTYDLDSLHVL